MPYLDQSKFALPKDESDYNVWADYIELLTLVHTDRNQTLETLKDRLLDENDNDARKALRQIAAVGRRVVVAQQDQIADDQPEDANDPEDEQKILTALRGVVDYMKCRKAIVSNYYPFTIDDHHSVSQTSPITDRHKVYIVLLISSLIRIIHRTGGHAYRITHRFENLCRHPFRLLLPQIATSEFFGAGGYASERPFPEPQTFFQKVQDLAGHLHLPMHPFFNVHAAGEHNVGDGGLDWVGWLPFADGLQSIPTFFAQCACGNDWEDKLFDANKEKWRKYILFDYDYKLFHFIPKSFRDLNNNWQNTTKLHTAILIDRFRIIELLEKAGTEDEVVMIYTDLFAELEQTAVDF